MSFAKPTLNRHGYQSSIPSPIVRDWIMSFDGQNPLLDIGCAFGINTYEALEENIPTIALDPSGGHLEILKNNCNSGHLHSLQCIEDSLPNLDRVKNESVSGILCSDVFHFLEGDMIEDSLTKMRQKLVPGGFLGLSVISDKFLGNIDKERHDAFNKSLSAGVKWPGEVKTDGSFRKKFESVMVSERMKSLSEEIIPRMLHFFCPEQLKMEVTSKGFEVIKSYYGEHPGHPDPEGIGKWEGRCVFIIAKKIA